MPKCRARVLKWKQREKRDQPNPREPSPIEVRQSPRQQQAGEGGKEKRMERGRSVGTGGVGLKSRAMGRRRPMSIVMDRERTVIMVSSCTREGGY